MKTPIVTYRKTGTLAARYLARAPLGERLAHQDADRETGSYQLGALAHYLKSQHGWPIERCQLRAATPDPIGRFADFTQYWLDKTVIRWEGTEGQEFAERVLKLEAKKIAAREAATSPTAEIQSEQLNILGEEHTTANTRGDTVMGGRHHG